MAGMLEAVAPATVVALVANTAKTVLRVIAPANQGLELVEVGVFFDGVSVTGQPVLIELLGYDSTNDQGGASTAITTTYDSTNGQIQVLNGAAWTPQISAKYNYTTEPTAVTKQYDVWEVHPQAGIDILLPLKQEIIVAGGVRLGLRCKAAAVVNVRPKFKLWE